MPMIKDSAPPLPQDRIRELRSSLPADYGHTLVASEGRAVLVIRVPSPAPDFLADIDRAAEVVSEEEVRAARDVLLIGDERLVRVDPIPLRDRVRERTREELPLVGALRATLQRAYGKEILRPRGTRGPAILALRIPRGAVAEITLEDGAALLPALDEAVKTARDIARVWIVAENDHRSTGTADARKLLSGETPPPVPRRTDTIVAGDRPQSKTGGFSGTPFAGLIGQAMETDQVLKAQKLARAGGPVQAAAAAPTPPPAVPAPPPAPRPATPSPVAGGPFGGLISDAVAIARSRNPVPPVAADPAPRPEPVPEARTPQERGPAVPADPLLAIQKRLAETGYEFAPVAAETGFDLAAHKEGGKKLLVKKVPTLDLLAGEELIRRAEGLEADAVVVVTDTPTPGTRAFALGTRLEIVRASDVDGLEL